jgi:hypothetical protein
LSSAIVEESDGVYLDTTLLKKSPLGPINSAVAFETTDPAMLMVIHVGGLVTGPIYANPISLVLGPLPPSVEDINATFQVVSRAGSEVKTVNIEVAGELQAFVSATASGDKVILKKSGDWSTVGRELLKGKILVETECDSKPYSVAVPVALFIANPKPPE